MTFQSNKAAELILRDLGFGLFRKVAQDQFAELLFRCACYGLGRESVADLQQRMGIEIPAAFVRLHRGKLKYWAVFSNLNTENPAGDTNYSGAIYHTGLNVGVMIDYNDCGGVNFLRPFEFTNGVLPEKEIIRALLDFIIAEDPPFNGVFTNHVPDVCSRDAVHDAYRRVNLAWLAEADPDYDAYFNDHYREIKTRRRGKIQK